MASLKKKRVFLALQIAALWLLVFSFAVVAVYAWFYKDSPFDIEIDPSEFGVEITYDIVGSPRIKYRARAATVFSRPDDEDRFFNSCVSCAEVSVKNIGLVDVKSRVQISVVKSATKDASGANVARTGTEYAVKYAIIKKSKAQISDVAGQPGVKDYKSAIQEQIDDPALGVTLTGNEALDEMNERVLADVMIAKDQTLTFLLAFWTDYFVLLDEYPYVPKNGPYMQTTYELRLKVKAVQFENA